jgi:hypothetical protein
MPIDELKAGIADVCRKWAQRGRIGEPVLSMRIPCAIEGVSQDVLHYQPRRPSREHLAGSIASIVERLGTYRDLGIQHLVLEMSTQSHEAAGATLDAFATHIRPQLRG